MLIAIHILFHLVMIMCFCFQKESIFLKGDLVLGLFVYFQCITSCVIYIIEVAVFRKAPSTQTFLIYLYMYFCLVCSSELLIIAQRFLISLSLARVGGGNFVS